jgi:hypothetical protein
MLKARLSYLITAANAVTELAFFDTLERRIYSHSLRCASALRGERHCLNLHCIDAGQSTDRVLV